MEINANADQKATQSLGEIIKNKRRELGLSQEELGSGHYSKAYISQIERNQLVPSSEFLTYLAERLDLSFSQLQGNNSVPSELKARRIFYEKIEFDLQLAEGFLGKKQFAEVEKLLYSIEPEQLPIFLQGKYYSLSGQLNLYKENSDYTAAQLDLEKALQLFENYTKVFLLDTEQARSELGLVHYRVGNYNQAIEYQRRCLARLEENDITSDHFRMKVFYRLANAYSLIGEHKQALEFYKKATVIADRLNDRNQLAEIHWGQALVYRADQNLNRAKIHLLESVSIYEDLAQLKLSCMVKSLLGMALVEREEFEEAEKVLISGRDLALSLKDDTVIAQAYVNLAYLWLKMEKTELALDEATKAVEIAQTINNPIVLGQALAQLAEVRLAKGEIEESLKFFLDSITVLKKTDMTNILNEVRVCYAKALTRLGKHLEATQVYEEIVSSNKKNSILER